MGEHGTWFDLLDKLPGWRHLSDTAGVYLGRRKPLLLVFGESHFSLVHVLWTALALLIVLWGCVAFRRSLGKPDGVLPPARFGFRVTRPAEFWVGSACR